MKNSRKKIICMESFGNKPVKSQTPRRTKVDAEPHPSLDKTNQNITKISSNYKGEIPTEVQ